LSRPTYQEIYERSTSPQQLTAAMLSGKNPDGTDYFPESATYRWNTGTLTWVPWDGVVTSSGGGGGASTIADGADVNSGSTTDAAVSTDTTGTLSGKVRGLVKLLASVITGGKVTVDGSSVTQPVSGTFFQATQPVSASSLPLPAGAATSALQTQPGVDIGDVTVNNAAGASSVNIQDGGNSITVDGTFWQATQPVSAASLPLPTGASTLAEQQSQTTALQLIDDAVYTDGTGSPSKALGIAGTDGTNPQIIKTDAAGELQVDVLTLPALPTGSNNIGDVDVLTVPAPLSTTGGGAEATALRVTLANDSTGLVSVDDNGGSLTVDGPLTDAQLRASAVPVSGTFFQGTQPVSISATVTTKEVRSATPTQTSVAGSASNVTLLAANSNRLGATIYNDSTAILYLKLGATASSSSHTVQMVSLAYFEVPYGYTGIIDGLWASATGNARITEIAA